ncbi:UxaA family hydrolase [Sporomusa acidovorans]|uniref:SAF domain-containing protein n=1 Tax=Sporomusa acidovorans (strain ATCC 49682 / DSM 3132 / Mol) TaxID=1123286 RepID=A0ABZ3J5P5_SPOA4|nr:UxaA family hydrolase [Sporomusa acidovorans]OZC24297.1 (2R)-sulfolactate sulfo-lyase subunit alpha [Sporomusa acidovorans DSM 3132]SDF02689.1 (2R)-sulfolactate sulfo-lyase subunit alpha [Sporomusa acidovorans]
MEHKILIHGAADTVGVAVQDIKAGETVIGVYLDTNTDITITSNYDIPLGHKIALKTIPAGEFVYEYGEKIGKATQNINLGDWAHVHNLKSARW